LLEGKERNEYTIVHICMRTRMKRKRPGNEIGKKNQGGITARGKKMLQTRRLGGSAKG
jgi:hypothetical protein